MDDAVKTIAELLASGGNAALLFLVFVGWRAANAAREVAADIKAMREALKDQAEMVRETARKVDAIEARLQREAELRQLAVRGAV